MAVKSKEMTASAMKVVIRKHLVCMSLTVKIGPRRNPGARCGKEKASAVMLQGGSALRRDRALGPHGLHQLCLPEAGLTPETLREPCLLSTVARLAWGWHSRPWGSLCARGGAPAASARPPVHRGQKASGPKGLGSPFICPRSCCSSPS